MTRGRGFGFVVVSVAAVVGLVYLQASAQIAPERQPIITEALIDVENATLTINGYDFSSSVPTVTLGMTPVVVTSASESALVVALPELQPGMYLLAVTWPDGAGAVFYLASDAGNAVPTFQ